MAAHSRSEMAPRALVVTTTHVNTGLLVAGRVLFGGYFVFASFDHFMQTAMLASAAAARGVLFPELAVLGSGCLIFVGGLSLLTGVVPRVGAALIALFLIGVTPVMHAFWSDPTPMARMADIVNFTKNVALLGATALVAALPEPWPARLRW